MSLVETFHKIPASKLPELVDNSKIITEKKLFFKKTVDNYWNYLEKNATELDGLDYNQFNGGVFMYVLSYLEDIAKINIAKGDFQEFSDTLSKNREASVLVFTITTKREYSELLDAEKFSTVEIQKYNEATYNDNDADTAVACKSAIALLKKHIDSIADENECIIFGLG